jgi:hypothetical protein
MNIDQCDTCINRTKKVLPQDCINGLLEDNCHGYIKDIKFMDKEEKILQALKEANEIFEIILSFYCPNSNIYDEKDYCEKCHRRHACESHRRIRDIIKELDNEFKNE